MSAHKKSHGVQETIVRRGGNPTSRAAANKHLGVVGGLEDELKKCRNVLNDAERHFRKEQNKNVKVQATLEHALNAVSAAQEVIDADPLPERAQPVGRISQRDNLRLKAQQLEAVKNAQQSVTTLAWEAVRTAEAKTFQADKKLNIAVDGLKDAEVALDEQRLLDSERTNKLGALEHTRAKRWETEQKIAINTRENQILDLQKVAEKQIAATQVAHATAAHKVTASSKKSLKTHSEAEKIQKEKWENRVQAVLELRDNQNAVRAKAATDSEKRANKIAAAAKQLEEEKTGLLSKGINPYAEFRQREISAQDAALEKHLKDAVEQNKADLATRLIREEDLRRQRDEAEAIEKEYEKKQRDALGRHVIETRNREYIASNTVDGREMLDASGRASRVDPSQITSFPDYSLGLGKSSRITPANMKGITSKIRQKLNVDKDDLGEYQRMLGPLMQYANQTNNNQKSISPGHERSQSAPNNDQGGSLEVDQKALDMLNTLGGRRGDMPGKSDTAAEVNAQPEGELELLLQLAEDENGSIQENEGGALSTKSPKYKINEQTKFEKDSLKRAKGRMATRRQQGVTQVAAGKTFKGEAFVANPGVLEYKDFQVGKVYRKKFTLTNVSYSFNSFQLLPLKDDIIDFFEIIYDKPGRMSAGVSCSLEIVFSPKINSDLFGHVQLLSQTGPINIPLQCLKRRCIPRVLTSEMDFGDVVIGQIVKKRITIKNTGALPTEFTIMPTPPDVSNVPEEVAVDGTEEELANNAAIQRESPRYNQLPGNAIDNGGDSTIDHNKSRPYGYGDPALNDAELASRTRLVITEIIRRKKSERPFPLAIEPTVGTDSSLGPNELISGSLAGYSSITVDVVCAPLSLGKQTREFQFYFSGVEDSDKSVDECGVCVTQSQLANLIVSGEDVPLYVAEEDLDFKTVLHDRIYRSKFTLKNRGSSSYRADITIPSPMNKYIDASPNSLYVQAGGSQIVNIKYTPTAEMLNHMAYFMLPNENFSDTAIMKLPLEMKVTNQDLPVFCVLNSTLTASTVHLSHEGDESGTAYSSTDPLNINFDRVYVNQSSTRGLTLTNRCILPQKIAFIKLKKEITVAPNDGFAVLLPNESVTFDVTFTALSAIKYDLEVQVATSQNDLYTVKVRALGIESPFELSNAVLKLRSTCPGQRVLESTMITNTTQKKQIFEVSTPESLFSWIKVSPLICELAPGDSKRLEFEFLPPQGLLEQDPLEWHNDIMFPPEPVKPPEPEPEPVVAPVSKGKGKAAAAAPVVVPNPTPVVAEIAPPRIQYISPFNTWKLADGWVMAVGPYGGIQWTKPAPVPDDEGSTEDGSVGGDEDSVGGIEIDNAAPGLVASDDDAIVEERIDELQPTNDTIELNGNSFSSTVDETELAPVSPTAGYIGNWSFPLYIKPRSSKHAGSSSTVTLADTAAFEDSQSSLPMFIKVQTVVVSNQYDVDTPGMDFGQISLGTRLIRTLKFRNNTTTVVTLRAEGLNSVGPFAILNAVRDVQPEEWISVVVECNPLISGLFNECIEFYGVTGGHHMRIPLRVQGVNPTVELSGLEDSNRVGKLLDFGNVVADDKAVKSFTIVNTSAFPVGLDIQRTVASGLAPRKRAEAVQRTMSGLPVFTFTPESYVIPEGGKVEVVLSFQPDRYRILPYREELDISIGKGTNSLPIKVHVCGRAQSRQLFATTGTPTDEAFYSQDFGISLPEDPLSLHVRPEVRTLAKQACSDLGAFLLPDKPMVLEYPDPYRQDMTATDTAAVEKDTADAPSILGAGAKAPPPGGSAEANLTQFRRVIVSAAKINDARGAATNASGFTYEVVLSQEAKDSGLFAMGSNVKGTVSVGTDAIVPIGCTLPRPRGLGGLQVGSWQLFKADVLLKGGWKVDGEPEEYKLPVLLKGFVRL